MKTMKHNEAKFVVVDVGTINDSESGRGFSGMTCQIIVAGLPVHILSFEFLSVTLSDVTVLFSCTKIGNESVRPLHFIAH